MLFRLRASVRIGRLGTFDICSGGERSGILALRFVGCLSKKADSVMDSLTRRFGMVRLIRGYGWYERAFSTAQHDDTISMVSAS